MALNCKIKSLVKAIPRLFSDDLNVEIELFRTEQQHYESDRAADIDNVIKPILDGLTGPDGVMIDDNQVHQIGCSWLDSTSPTPSTIVTDKPHSDTYVMKDGLLLVHMGKQLYFPLTAKLLDNRILDLLDAFKKFVLTLRPKA